MKRLSFRCATLFLFIIASAWATRSYSYTFEADGLYYDINPDGTTVTVTYDSYLSGSYAGDIVVPDSVDYNGRRLAVTSIGASAFRACAALTSVTLPAGIESISNYAFTECTALTAVAFGGNEKVIGDYAFDNCGALEAAVFPATVTTVGDCAFRDCAALAELTLSDALTTIGRWTFINCTALRRLEIPASVTEIGASAFQSCSSLDSVAINLRPDTHLTVGKFVFFSCKAISTVTTNDLGQWCSIEFIDVNANPINFSHSISIGGQAISNLEIPQGVSRIEKYAFYSCSSLQRVQLPNSLKEIADSAFWHCYGLNAVTSLAPAPPAADMVFVDFNFEHATLNVPYAATEAYRTTSPWRDFEFINELPAPKLGDINADGSIDGGDVSILLEMVHAGGLSDEQKLIADLNADGSIDDVDVSVLLGKVLNNDDDDDKSLRILAIGNSFTQDVLTYLGDLAKASGIESADLKVYITYSGGASLEYYSNLIETETLPDGFFFQQYHGAEEFCEYATFADIISHDWDIITLQQVSTLANDYNSYQPYLDKLATFIREKCPNKNVALGWNLVWGVGSMTADDPGTSRWQKNAEACRQMLLDTDYFSFIVPSGTAVQNARALGIDNIGHFITRDNLHLCYGAGLYVAACAWWEAIIAPWCGKSIVGSPAVHPITAQEQASSPNPCMPVTADNNIILQLCAAKAIEKPFELSADEIAAEAAERYGISDIPAMFPSE